MKDFMHKKVLIELWLNLIKEFNNTDKELKLDYNSSQSKSEIDYTVNWSHIDSLIKYFLSIFEYKEIKELHKNWKDELTKNQIEVFRKESKIKYLFIIFFITKAFI